jgi:hypothetical protein
MFFERLERLAPKLMITTYAVLKMPLK